MTLEVAEVAFPGYESVLWCADPVAEYRAVLVIHSTAAGPAVGGTRLKAYQSDGMALADALRLARGMTAKNVMAGIPLGGGKAVIMAPHGLINRPRLMAAHGRAVASCGGRYITAGDVGTTTEDMEIIASETPHVAGRAGGRAGDSAPHTARGVLRAMRAGADFVWGTPVLAGRTVAVQGLGKVGFALIELLLEAGAKVVATDVDPARMVQAHRLGVGIVRPEDIYDTEADIFSPCALGGTLNGETIERLRVRLVAGGANNQLARDCDGDRLYQRGILLIPDYVSNVGGVLSGTMDILGWDEQRVAQQIDRIADTAASILWQSHDSGIAPHRVADNLAAARLLEIAAAKIPAEVA